MYKRNNFIFYIVTFKSKAGAIVYEVIKISFPAIGGLVIGNNLQFIK